MGYCYTHDGRLCCDACGHAGGVRKRTCPHRVRYPEGGSLPYCSPAALCANCYATHKATLHARCAQGAAESNAREADRGRRLAAGEYEVRTAWGAWAEGVPDGFVCVRFVAANGVETHRLIPEPEYAGRGWLSEYPTARECPAPSGRPKPR